MSEEDVYRYAESYNNALQSLIDFAEKSKVPTTDIPSIEQMMRYATEHKQVLNNVVMGARWLYEAATLYNEEWVRAKLKEEQENGR
jgi:hypothetical protein